MKNNEGVVKKRMENVLLKLYLKGKLGVFPMAENKLRVASLFMRDYRFSLFTQKTTFRYDMTFVSRSGGVNDFSLTKQDATDRYCKALKAVGKYQVYALHFLRDEENVRSFILKYPILNKGCKRTYEMVYLGLNKMLEKLVDFYDCETRKE